MALDAMIFLFREINNLGSGLCQCFDALGAEHFFYRAAFFHHEGLLQVRFELAVGGSLGEGAVVTEGCGFSTMCAFCHLITFLSCYNSSSNYLFGRHDILSRDLFAGKMLK